MSDEIWIVIPKWDDFQHRDSARSSVPPWIKDYTDQLAKDEYRDLSFAQRGLLANIRQEYARSRRELRGNPTGLSQRLGQKVSKKSLQPLIDAGFIELSASKPARHYASNPAGVEKRREEKKPPYPPYKKNGQAPVERIATMIRNGVPIDEDYLESEPLTDEQRAELRAMLHEIGSRA